MNLGIKNLKKKKKRIEKLIESQKGALEFFFFLLVINKISQKN
jgi:hypothetical protein